MAKESRITFTFAADGATVTATAAGLPSFVYSLDNMCAEARSEAFNLGVKTALQNTYAGAAKLGWTDEQCMAQVRRRAMGWAKAWSTGDAVRDFHYLATAFAEKTGKDMAETERLLRELSADDRKLVEKKLSVRILELKLADAQKRTTDAAHKPDNGKAAALLAMLD